MTLKQRRWRADGRRQATGDDGDDERRAAGDGQRATTATDDEEVEVEAKATMETTCSGRRATTSTAIGGGGRGDDGRVMQWLNIELNVDGRLFAPREKNVGIQYSHRVAHGRGRRRVRISNFKFQN